METGNATDAYRKAYPNSIGWKDGVVSKRAFELLRNPSVASRVNELQADILKKSDMKKEDALRFLTNVVNVDPIDLQLKGKNTFIVRSLDDIPKPVRCCIHSIWSRDTAIQQNSRHYTDKQDAWMGCSSKK